MIAPELRKPINGENQQRMKTVRIGIKIIETTDTGFSIRLIFTQDGAARSKGQKAFTYNTLQVTATSEKTLPQKYITTPSYILTRQVLMLMLHLPLRQHKQEKPRLSLSTG